MRNFISSQIIRKNETLSLLGGCFQNIVYVQNCMLLINGRLEETVTVNEVHDDGNCEEEKEQTKVNVFHTLFHPRHYVEEFERNFAIENQNELCSSSLPAECLPH